MSFEVFGQYGADTFRARDELFEHHLAVLAGMAGLDASRKPGGRPAACATPLFRPPPVE
ncbi:UNVERIFIED_ORG: hypothetical protein ABIB19_001755 [Arthrobacter sp. UYEF10]